MRLRDSAGAAVDGWSPAVCHRVAAFAGIRPDAMNTSADAAGRVGWRLGRDAGELRQSAHMLNFRALPRGLRQQMQASVVVAAFGTRGD
mmetsp:Transcript_5948/g.17653  ORF Transcript_5948/g.17653 Transcript_5948/m.17653 type:complete len:89 (-) Transcript_5948:330-596(-)